jgi:hypothetical protein
VRVLVCGGRDFNDREAVFTYLDRLHSQKPISHIIHGAARGADTLAGEWAGWAGVTVSPYPADWGTHGKAAGALRNRAMLVEGEPNLVIAFPGGRGTADMVRRAEAAGIPVRQVTPPESAPR